MSSLDEADSMVGSGGSSTGEAEGAAAAPHVALSSTASACGTSAAAASALGGRPWSPGGAEVPVPPGGASEKLASEGRPDCAEPRRCAATAAASAAMAAAATAAGEALQPATGHRAAGEASAALSAEGGGDGGGSDGGGGGD